MKINVLEDTKKKEQSSNFIGMEGKKCYLTTSSSFSLFQFYILGQLSINSIIKAFIAIIVFEAYQKGALNKYIYMSFSMTMEVREVHMNLNPLWQ